jgi:predicted dithiol-disulfide oxidoreductase (DUF899 family)
MKEPDEGEPMSLPEIVSAAQWREARIALLEKEKAMTRARDELSAERRRLPMVEITKDYRFQGPQGEVGLLEMFEGRLQLIVGHFMFHPEWEDGCPSCSAGADEVADGLREHLAIRGTTLAYVSRAPLEKIERYKAKKGWTFPWYSSAGSDFNYDFDVTLDSSVKPMEFNYRGAPEAWEESEQPFDMPGTSCFLRDGERVFHTYSSYARGGDLLIGTYNWLDLTARGRQEDWEEPAGRSDGPMMHWVRRHDQYET